MNLTRGPETLIRKEIVDVPPIEVDGKLIVPSLFDRDHDAADVNAGNDRVTLGSLWSFVNLSILAVGAGGEAIFHFSGLPTLRP